jgi:hypothetical protein
MFCPDIRYAQGNHPRRPLFWRILELLKSRVLGLRAHETYILNSSCRLCCLFIIAVSVIHTKDSVSPIMTGMQLHWCAEDISRDQALRSPHVQTLNFECPTWLGTLKYIYRINQ